LTRAILRTEKNPFKSSAPTFQYSIIPWQYLLNSAIPLNVGPLAEPEFTTLLTKKFIGGNRLINEEILHKVFEICNPIPGPS
jgi:hypothetical protein